MCSHSKYYPTSGLRHTTHATYLNSYMFQHWDAMLQVGFYTFVVITPWVWHLGVETCRSLHVSCVAHLRDNVLIVRPVSGYLRLQIGSLKKKRSLFLEISFPCSKKLQQFVPSTLKALKTFDAASSLRTVCVASFCISWKDCSRKHINCLCEVDSI